jgi:hypothetical protein
VTTGSGKYPGSRGNAAEPGYATSQEQARKPTTSHESAERLDLRAYFFMRIGPVSEKIESSSRG